MLLSIYNVFIICTMYEHSCLKLKDVVEAGVDRTLKLLGNNSNINELRSVLSIA